MKKGKGAKFRTSSNRTGRFGTSSPSYATGITKEIVAQIQASLPASDAPQGDSTASPSSRPTPEYGKLAGYPTISPEEMDRMPKLKFLKNSLSTMTYEQALKNLRALRRATNLLPISTAGDTKKTKKMTAEFNKRYAALTEQQKMAEKIFFLMGGSLKNKKTGQVMGSGTANKGFYESIGLTAPTTKYAPIGYSQTQSNTAIVDKLNNPLSQAQRSKLQNLRALAKSGGLTDRQKQQLDRLVSKKNAPRVIE